MAGTARALSDGARQIVEHLAQHGLPDAPRHRRWQVTMRKHPERRQIAVELVAVAARLLRAKAIDHAQCLCLLAVLGLEDARSVADALSREGVNQKARDELLTDAPPPAPTKGLKGARALTVRVRR